MSAADRRHAAKACTKAKGKGEKTSVKEKGSTDSQEAEATSEGSGIPTVPFDYAESSEDAAVEADAPATQPSAVATPLAVVTPVARSPSSSIIESDDEVGETASGKEESADSQRRSSRSSRFAALKSRAKQVRVSVASADDLEEDSEIVAEFRVCWFCSIVSSAHD